MQMNIEKRNCHEKSKLCTQKKKCSASLKNIKNNKLIHSQGLD